MPAVRRSLAAVALAPLALTGLVACGDDNSASNSSTSVRAGAPAAAPGEGVAPAAFTHSIEHGFDAVTTAHMTMTVTSARMGEIKAEGDIDRTGDSPAAAMTMDLPMAGGQADIRLVDKVMYLKMGQLTGGKFWKLDLDDPHSPFSSFGSQLDPESSFRSLAKGLAKVRYVGQEEVGGQRLDHYRASIDTQKIADRLQGMVGSGASIPKGALPGRMQYDVWLDSQGRPTKVTTQMGQAGSMTMTMSDWGAPVDIQAPPSDQVTPMPDLGSMMGSMMQGMNDAGTAA